MKLFQIWLLFLLLTGCTPYYLAPNTMAPLAGIYAQLPQNSSLEKKIQVGSIYVSPEVSGYPLAAVSKENFKLVLEMMLNNAHYQTPTQEIPVYVLEASLIDLGYEGWFGMDGHSKAKYTLTNMKTKEILWEETISSSSHVDYVLFSDGVIRAREAVGLAVRENLTHLIRVLSSQPFLGVH